MKETGKMSGDPDKKLAAVCGLFAPHATFSSAPKKIPKG